MIIKFDLPPIQGDFEEDDIRTMIVGRRQLRTEWPRVMYAPNSPEKDWCAILPFPNTYQNAFSCMCDADVYAHHTPTGKLCLFLRGTAGHAAPPDEVTKWIETVGKPVVMKDFLALSFALDYDKEGGGPNQTQTEVGALRAIAKPYGGSAATAQTKVAAKKLADKCVEFLNGMTCYKSADCIVAMPPSDPTKQYNLPKYLAERISEATGLENLTEQVLTVELRDSIKGVALKAKFDTLLGTIKVVDNAFEAKRVILVDDLYQSGTSMNYCGLMLLRAGAKKIFGLACEKTCRNDDNVGGRM
jgi:hypothetical protein